METDYVQSIEEITSKPPQRRYKIIGPTPVNGKKFRIQSLYEAELSSYQAQAVGKDGFRPAKMEDANRRLIARCLVNADGNRLLSDSQANVLATWDAADTNFLYNECALWVGLKREDPDNLEKNSVTTSGDALLIE